MGRTRGAAAGIASCALAALLAAFVCGCGGGGGGGGGVSGAITPSPPSATPTQQVSHTLTSAAFDPGKVAVDDATGLKMVSNQTVVTFVLNTSETRIAEILAARGAKIVGMNSAMNSYQVEMPDGVAPQSFAEDMAKLAEVTAATPNYIFPTTDATPPNDPVFKTGEATEEAQPFVLIRAVEAWNEAGNKAPLIAILDTGIDTSHPEFSGRIAGGKSFVSASEDDYGDTGGHGTAVAGVIAAAGNNGQGMAGMCWNCKLIAVKVCESGSCPLFAVLNGIIYASDSGATVINISLGESFPEGSVVKTLFETAISLTAGGDPFIVAPAGNRGGSADSYLPASLPGVFSVGATADDDTRAAFSNFGETVDAAAPGEGIYTTARQGGYSSQSGTSLSAAFVSGLAGLLLTVNGAIPSADLREIIASTAKKLTFDQPLGSGRIDAYAAAVVAKQYSGNIEEICPSGDCDDALVDGITVSPENLAIKKGAIIPYFAKENRLDGTAANISPLWSVEGGVGTITLDGIFTALVEGSGKIIAERDGMKGNTTVMVTPNVQLKPASACGMELYTDSSYTTPATYYLFDQYVYIEVTDADENADPATRESVFAIVEDGTSDKEFIILVETGPDTGVFRNTGSYQDLKISTVDPGGNDSGILQVVAGANVTAKYDDTDPPVESCSESAAVNPSKTTSILLLTNSSWGSVTQYQVGSNIYIEVKDNDQNLDGMDTETITVAVTSSTGDREDNLTLTETGDNTGIFRNTSSALTTTTTANPNNNGSLYVTPGSSITATYTDPDDATDTSFKIAPIIFSSVKLTDGSWTLVEKFTIGTNIYIEVADQDQNLDPGARDTLTVTVTDSVTGDTETVSLIETGNNTNLFRNTADDLPTSTAPTVPNNGTLSVRAGSNVTVVYVDPDNPLDTSTDTAYMQPPAVNGTVKLTDASWNPKSSYVAEAENVYIELNDSDQNLNSTIAETYYVTVSVASTGDVESVLLMETGPNTGVFRLLSSVLPTVNSAIPQADGKLQVQPGVEITVSYQDLTLPVGGADSDSDTAFAILGPTDSDARFKDDTWGDTSDYNYDTDDAFLEVTDPDQNLNALAPDTVQVTVTVSITGDTAVFQLVEVGNNSGVFRLSNIDIQKNTTPAADQILQVAAGSVLTLDYVDPDDPTDTSQDTASIASPLTPCQMTVQTTSVACGVAVGDSFIYTVTDPNRNTDGATVETVTITVNDTASGDTENVTLTESGPDTGVFVSPPVPTDKIPVVPGNGTVETSPPSNIVGTYTDTMDAGDVCTAGRAITPTFVFFYNQTSASCVNQFVLGMEDIYVEVGDIDKNVDPGVADTFTLDIVNSATGDSENITLVETGPDTGVFLSLPTPITTSTTPPAPNDGDLSSDVGQQIRVDYGTPPDDIFAVANIIPPPSTSEIKLMDSSWTTEVSVYYYAGVPQNIYIEVNDQDQNMLSGFVETMVNVVQVTASIWDDTEMVSLVETGPDTGIFRNTADPLIMQMAAGAADDGNLQIEIGSQVFAEYTDPNEMWDNDDVTVPVERPPADSAALITDATFITELVQLEAGDDLYIQVSDPDQDKKSLDIDTITVTLTCIDSEGVTLIETGPSTGIFNNQAAPFPTSIAAGAPGDGTLQVFFGNQVTVSYTDPNDGADTASDTVDIVQKPTVSETLLGNASYSSVTEYKIGDAVYIQVSDMDQNLDMLAPDQVPITVTAGFTGDEEQILLVETGDSTGIFRNTTDSLGTSSSPGAEDDGTLQIYPGSAITATYVDPTDPGDSTLAKATAIPVPTAAVATFVDDTLGNGVFDYFIGEDVHPLVTDNDQNRNIQLSDIPGEYQIYFKLGSDILDYENVTISEVASSPARLEVNTGVFSNATDTLPTSFTPGASYDGTLYAVPGGAAFFNYTDPVNGDTAWRMITFLYPPGPSATRLTDSDFNDVNEYVFGDSVYIEVSDFDEDRNVLAPENANVNVDVQCKIGETVVGQIDNFWLNETGPNTGVFRSPVPLTMSLLDEPGAVLQVAPGCSIVATYTDTYYSTVADTSFDQAPVRFDATPGSVAIVDPDTFARLSILPVTDQIYVETVDIDENEVSDSPDPVAGTFTVTLQSLNPDRSLLDEETVALVETGNSTGIFRSLAEPIAMSTTTVTFIEDGVLRVEIGGKIVATYTDDDDPSDTSVYEVTISSSISNSQIRVANASWITVANYEPGDSVYIEVTDPDENLDGTMVDTVTVILDCCYTGTTSYESVDADGLFLTETGVSTGIFRSVARVLTTSETTGDGDFFKVQLNKNIHITYTDQSDPLDMAETFTPVKIVLPRPPTPSADATSTEIDLSWSPPTTNTDGSPMTDLDGFKIYRSATSGGPYTLIYSEPDETATTYVDTDVVPWTKYYYVMTSYNTDVPFPGGDPEESGYSAQRAAWLDPANPVNFVRTCGCKKPNEPYVILSTPGYLNQPTAITTDGAGNIYLADTMNNRVQKFDITPGECVFTRAWGTLGAGVGEFQYPTGIEYNPADGNLYVADYHNRVQVFTTNGAYVRTIPVTNAVTVAADTAGTVYVSRAGSAIISKFDTAGAPAGAINYSGAAGLSVSAAGRLLVTDTALNRIASSNSSGGDRNYLGAAGNDFRQFSTPRGVHISPTGDIYVADTENDRIQVFDGNLEMINMFGVSGLAPEELQSPTDVTIDPATDRLFIVDKMNNCVKEFLQ